MRVVALEEHFSVPSLAQTVDRAAIAARGHFAPRKFAPGHGNPMEFLPEIGERRLQAMDDAGIAVQVLSYLGPGPDLVAGPGGTELARRINDHLAEAIARHPDRFTGFATLPMLDAKASAAELERCVKKLGMVGAMIHGTTGGRFLDDPMYDALLATTVALDVPIYVHPSVPTPDIKSAYFSALPEGADRILATAGWGWHSECGLHILRMLANGIFDKHPKLKIIIGHMGEMLPMMLTRLDDVFGADIPYFERTPSQTIVEQVWITTSGIFSQPPFDLALRTFGIDRIMFSVDYPFAFNAQGRRFLDETHLPPADFAKLCSGNADALLKLKP